MPLPQAGADLQARTQLGGTPLTLAVAEGRAEAVGLLLEARADANALGACDAENPLDLAERRSNQAGFDSNAFLQRCHSDTSAII